MKYLPPVLISVFLTYLLIKGIDINSAIVMVALSGMYSLHYFIEAKKPTKVNSDVYEKLAALEAELKSQKEKISSINLMSIKR